jgi:hypothetical protein
MDANLIFNDIEFLPKIDIEIELYRQLPSPTVCTTIQLTNLVEIK